MSEADPHRYLRYVLTGVAALDTVVLAADAHRKAAEASRPGEHWPEHLVASTPSVIFLAAVSLVSLSLFVRRRVPLAAGLVALATLAVLEHTKATFTFAGHSRIFFAGGAALAGWLFGLAFARRVGREGDPSYAEAGAIAGLAATYVDAGLSKVLDAGLMWGDANSVRIAVLTNHPIDDTSALGTYARFIVDNDAAARALAIATLVLELGAFVYTFGPRARRIWGTLLLAFHVNVALVAQNIFYVQACVLLVAFSYPWVRRPISVESSPSPERTRAAARRAGAWIAGAVAVAWLARVAGAFGSSEH
jgi:hypothetical protein